MLGREMLPLYIPVADRGTLGCCWSLTRSRTEFLLLCLSLRPKTSLKLDKNLPSQILMGALGRREALSLSLPTALPKA